MRLVIEFNSADGQDVYLPLQYNHMMQAAIYRTLDPELATFLHDFGYLSSGRKFKLFTFSRLNGKFQINKDTIVFTPPLQLTVSSPNGVFCQSLLNGILSCDGIQLGNVSLLVSSVHAEQPEVMGESIKFKLLSPVVAYSTLTRADGSKYTCYYQPGDNEFTKNVGENLRKKYQAISNFVIPDGEFRVKPLYQPKLHVLRFKGTVIKGYSGLLRLEGPKELLQVAVDAGLGSKNSMGFGCGEIVK